MKRTLAALAGMSLLSSTASAQPCAPRVALSGDGEAVARVEIELARLGVSLASSDATVACAPTTAVVERAEHGISVAVQNAAHRRESRVVSDARVAATWIDSWVRDELEVASWSEDATPTPTTPPPTAPVVIASPPGVAVVRAVSIAKREAARDRYSLSAGITRSWTSDATTWDGVEGATCARIGPLCLGGRVRAVFQSDLVHDMTTVDRSEVVALATASLPLSVGQIQLSPEIGIGAGRLRTKRSDTCTSLPGNPDAPTCTPSDPTCVVTPIAPGDCGDGYDQTSYRPRVALGLGVALPIASFVWLDASASYALSPFTATPVAIAPAEPSSGYQLGLGVRVGLP